VCIHAVHRSVRLSDPTTFASTARGIVMLRRAAIVAIGIVVFSASTAQAEDEHIQGLHIGDQAPQLAITQWFNRGPIETFEHGKVYVVEFWAT